MDQDPAAPLIAGTVVFVTPIGLLGAGVARAIQTPMRHRAGDERHVSWKIGQQIWSGAGDVRCVERVDEVNLADRPVHGDRAVRDRGAHRGERLIEVLEGAVMQSDGLVVRVAKRRSRACARVRPPSAAGAR